MALALCFVKIDRRETHPSFPWGRVMKMNTALFGVERQRRWFCHGNRFGRQAAVNMVFLLSGAGNSARAPASLFVLRYRLLLHESVEQVPKATTTPPFT